MSDLDDFRRRRVSELERRVTVLTASRADTERILALAIEHLERETGLPRLVVLAGLVAIDEARRENDRELVDDVIAALAHPQQEAAA